MPPEWITSQRPARGMCERCQRVPGQTFWHSLAGLLLCLACAEMMREDGRP